MPVTVAAAEDEADLIASGSASRNASGLCCAR